MGVDRVAAAVRTSLAALPVDALTRTADLLEEAQQTLEDASRSSGSQDLRNAVAGLAEARRLTAVVQDLVSRTASGLTAYLGTLGVKPPSAPQSSPAAGTIPSPPEPARKPTRTADGRRLSHEQAAALAAVLPPPVTRSTGQKTHGRWVDEHGQAHELVSGNDAGSDAAWTLLQERGIPLKAAPVTVSHVEQKLAARMVAEGRNHVDLVLNNRPCRNAFGCDTLLPIMLPSGYSVTIHAPNYRKTFTGGLNPWSR
ncbi:DddA-like double-stranded DNA deaminase toxin [Amycolatopsis sp. NBC_00438]|uniref:DddA-like double-stranded DNA deaminase toxin n=1 Tax=Amycolatopsis sp. NBC_00438 TaxID=2903558 RepID=UPI002E1FE307